MLVKPIFDLMYFFYFFYHMFYNVQISCTECYYSCDHDNIALPKGGGSCYADVTLPCHIEDTAYSSLLL